MTAIEQANEKILLTIEELVNAIRTTSRSSENVADEAQSLSRGTVEIEEIVGRFLVDGRGTARPMLAAKNR